MGDKKGNSIRLTPEIAEAVAKAGIEAYNQQMKKAQAERTDRRLHNTKLLLRNYRMFKAHSENAVYDLETADETVNDVLESMISGHYNDSSLLVDSIKVSAVRTALIVNHIDRMLGIYETYCYNYGTPEDPRRYRIIEVQYISDKKLSVNEILEMENISKTTYYDDMKIAIESLSAIIFGIDGIHTK